MKQLYYNTTMPIRTLIGQIETHQLALPELQRPFVWTDKKVRNLFDSLYNGFPIGSITLWRCSSSSKSHFIGMDGQEHIAPTELIIDGQQRLTSLYSVILGKPVMNANMRPKRIVISFNPLEEKFEVYGSALKNNPEWIPDISVLYTTDRSHDLITAFIERLSAYREANGNPLTQEEINLIPARLNEVQYLQNTNFHIIEILADSQEEDVSEMFVRLNSSSTPLRQHDFILTLFSLYWEEGRTEIEKYCKRHLEQSLIDNGSTIGTQSQDIVRTLIAVSLNRAQLKYAYKLLHGADFDNKGEIDEALREQRFAELDKKLPLVLDENKWNRFWEIIKSSGYVTAKMIPSHATVFYTYALYLIAIERFNGYGRENKAPLEALIALWFYYASLTSLYSDESVMEAQLNAIKTLETFDQFKQYLLDRISESFTNDYFNVTLTGSSGLAASGSGNNAWMAYNASLVVLKSELLFSRSGRLIGDLLDHKQTKKSRKMLDKHHLFPRAYLKESLNLPEYLINQMANYSYIDWLDNEIIQDADPSAYYSSNFILKDVSDELKTKWESDNALPSGWENMEYDQFLLERRKLMAQKIKQGYEILLSRI